MASWLVELSNKPALSAEIAVHLLAAFTAKIWENWTDAQWIRTVNAHDECLTITKFNVVSGSPHVGEKLLQYVTVSDSAHFLIVYASAEMEQDKTPVAPDQTS